MAFAHGRSTDGVYYHTQDLTAYSTDWSVDLTGDVEETTTFGNAPSRTYIRGLNSGSGSVSGLYDNAADQVLFDSLSDGTVDAFTIIPETQAIGGRVYAGGGLDTSFSSSSSVGGVTSWSLDVQGTGFSGGRLLNTSTALTTTGANSSYDSGASSANGGVAVFHFVTDDVTTMTCAIQDSSDDAAFNNVDEQTFTTVTSVATVVTGTIDRYLRFNVSVFTGTSAVVIASFVRFA
jgi:hypothetical protein